MTIDEAKTILRANGKPTCPCKYDGSLQKMIEEAIKITNIKNLV
jgi:hypothetical protein